MTDTKGNRYHQYFYLKDMKHTKEISSTESNGSLIAYESGETVTYGLFSAQERGTLFVGAW